MRRLWFGILAISLGSLTLRAADDDYRTVDTAVTAKVQPAATPAKAIVPGFLGVHVQPNSKGQPVVGDIQPESPGEKAGLKVGTCCRGSMADVPTVDDFRPLRSKAAGDPPKLSVTATTARWSLAVDPVSHAAGRPACPRLVQGRARQGR